MLRFNKNNKNTDKSSNDLFYYCFPGLSGYSSLCHRVFTRKGGVSKHPYKSLNISHSVKDNPDDVDQNLLLAQESTGAKQLVHMSQQHGKKVISLKKDKTPDLEIVFEADAIITDMTSVAIMVKQADCQGVILFDPIKSVVSVVHSGWKGSVQNILGETVNRMKKDFDCLPENILAAIGPSLGPCCSEFKAYNQIFPAHFKKHMVQENYFDSWEISKMQLVNAGLEKKSIEKSNICTKCNTDIFFSYRAEDITGRFATVAMLR